MDIGGLISLHGLLPTSGESFMSTAPLKIDLLRKNSDVFSHYFTRCMYFFCLTRFQMSLKQQPALLKWLSFISKTKVTAKCWTDLVQIAVHKSASYNRRQLEDKTTRSASERRESSHRLNKTLGVKKYWRMS